MSENKQKKTIVSVIITFHHEGIIAHKRMLNIFKLIEPLEKQGIKYEIILHIDNGDALTIEYLDHYKNEPNMRIFQNSFGNPSDARNFCVEQAVGKYVAILDGDDMMSFNWLIDGFHMLENRSEPAILHAEIDLRFGASDEPWRLWHMSDSHSDDEDTLYMFTRNRWSAGIMLPLDVAKHFPYKKTRQGFGYEDWTFNMDTRSAGILHLVVPKSVQFYRASDRSTSVLHGADNAVTYYSDLFNTEHMKELANRINSSNSSIVRDTKSDIGLARRAIRAFYDTACAIPGARKVVGKHLEGVRRRLAQNKLRNVEDFFMQSLREMNQIDNEIWPNPYELHRLNIYSSEYNYLGVIYCRLVAKMRKNPDYLFLPPQLSVGGTEKVIANFLQAFARLHPDWHIVVLSSIPKNHPFKFADNVDFIDFFEIIKNLENWERDFLLSRLIVQTRVKRLHIIHNDLAFRWVKSHLDLVVNNDYKVYISQFMYEYNHDPRLKVGFVDPYIRNIYPAITKIIADNEQIIRQMKEIDAFADNKLSIEYQPVEMPKQNLLGRPIKKPNSPLRILWASRVAEQKRPDLLKKIGKQLDPSKFIIDAYGRRHKKYNKTYFDDAPAIHYKGSYNGLDSIDLADYDVFLYTSQTDGLPNVLLEVCSLGLPVVASDVGGVSDLINGDTGTLVEMEDIDGYVAALEAVKKDPKSAHAKAKRAHALVKQRHTFAQFCKQVEEDIK